MLHLHGHEKKIFLECNWYFCRACLYTFYIVVKFQTPSCITFRDMNFCLVNFNTNLHVDKEKSF